MTIRSERAFVALALLNLAATSSAQDWRWRFAATSVEGDQLAGIGPPARLTAPARFGPAEHGGGLLHDGLHQYAVVAEHGADLELPTTALTVAAWVSIDAPTRWGGLAGCIQDQGESEHGWLLGYDERVFTFALSTVGADDGDGLLTYQTGSTPFELGRWHHVVATYDGTVSSLYLDGRLETTSRVQHGALAMDPTAPFVLGAYRDANELYPHDGRLLEVRVLGRALGAEAVRALFDERAELTRRTPWIDTTLLWNVAPYLTWPTRDGVSVLFEASAPCAAMVEAWSEDGAARFEWISDEARTLHEFPLRGLRPDAKYFYRVKLVAPTGESLEAPVQSFRTAATADHAYTFVVVGDTQSQPEVAKRVSDLAYMHRPNFVLHAGDLVDTGSNVREWRTNFFPSMQPLIGHVPLAPVLGNHEQDAPEYYAYMSLPAPEYRYSFEYGNAEFFMLDGNRTLAQGSEQLRWLAEALERSRATWKFAVLHQPPYTSDGDDYGDTHNGISLRGDPNVRNIVALLEQHGVDICFSGHVHDYERTFPIKDGRVTAYEDGGVVYVTAAGAGGFLEEFDPTNTWFGHKKANYHHLVYLAVHGGHLEFQAIDQEGRLFDLFTLRKDASGARRTPTQGR